MLKTIVKSAALAAALLCTTALAPAAQAAAPPPTSDAFSRLPVIDHVSVSPDGKHIAAITSPDGKTAVISIWSTDALEKGPRNIGSLPSQRFMSVQFIKNDRIAVRFRSNLDVQTIHAHSIKTAIMDLENKSAVPILPDARVKDEDLRYYNQLGEPTILSTLPGDPKYILVQDTRLAGNDDIFKVNVYTGSAEKVLAGSDKFGGYQVDQIRGEIRARQTIDFDNGAIYIAQYIKHPDTGAWEEHFRWYGKDREPMSIVGFTDDPNVVFVSTSKGRDKAAIYEYSIRDRKMLEAAFEHPLFEAVGVQQSRLPADKGKVLGFIYQGETTKRYWVDETLGGLEDQLRQALGVKTVTVDWTDPASGKQSRFQSPDGFDVNIVSYSDDMKYVIVEKSGPSLPPEYYMLSNGKLMLLGKSRPQIDPSTLGETRLIEYTARDGMIIPAFLTTPPKSVYGAGPFPAIVLPHGGPWARDNLDWDFSGWTQYFASRGYVVIQPQFRGSEGWGQKLWRAGDGEWGQKMQDDDDDAAKWLIANKFAAPDRIALHGYSYGGYTAFAGAVRPNGLYQCTIAGAGVAELANFKRLTFENRFQREFQNPTIAGLDPLSHAAQVSVPMLIYHGDRDQTVPIKESRNFSAALKAAGKPYKYIELPDMGHQFIFWSPDNQRQVLDAIDAYLKTDCGPGGL